MLVNSSMTVVMTTRCEHTVLCVFSSESSMVGSSGHVFDTMALEIEQLLTKVNSLATHFAL